MNHPHLTNPNLVTPSGPALLVPNAPRLIGRRIHRARRALKGFQADLQANPKNGNASRGVRRVTEEIEWLNSLFARREPE